MRGLIATVLASIVLAGRSGFAFFGETGLACSNPPVSDPGADQRDPFGPGSPFADRDLTAMAPAEVAAVAIEAGLDVTYRLSYRIGEATNEGQGGYSECWCIPPPIGTVNDLAFDSGGRLIIFVDAGQTLGQVRAQPRMGWGCAEPGASGATVITSTSAGRPWSLTEPG